MHAEAREFVWLFASGKTFRRVIEFGSLDINGAVRDLFAAKHYTGVDRQNGPGVDVVEDVVTFRSYLKADCVVCCEVLEHAEDVEGVIRSAAANLTLGGWLVVTCATDPRAPHSAVDGGKLRDGEHYRNVPPQELVEHVERAGFMLVAQAVDEARGDLRLVAQLRVAD